MKLGFVMDPVQNVNVREDTTFALMLAAQARGWDIYYIRPQDLGAREDAVWAQIHQVEVRPDPEDKVTFGDSAYAPLHGLDCIWMRKDPPFDTTYLYEANLLELAQRKGCLVINEPRGLRAANEKLYSLHFPELTPATVVTSEAKRILEFMADQDNRCVIKPLSGHGGEGVFVLEEGDRNLNALIEMSTSHGSVPVMCQEYLPEARQGDKRIILLDGQPLGAILRVPRDEEHRSNIHVGGVVEKTTLSQREQHICDVVGPRLVEDGLTFVGIDVIGERLTEVNVTSPTGIQEMSRLDGIDGADRVMEWIDEQVASS